MQMWFSLTNGKSVIDMYALKTKRNCHLKMERLRVNRKAGQNVTLGSINIRLTQRENYVTSYLKTTENTG